MAGAQTMMLSRRSFASALAALAAAPAWAHHQGTAPTLEAAHPFSVDLLRDRLRQRAARAYAPRPTIPQDWLDLSYDLYRSIWFKHPRALWHDQDRPLNVDFFHPGLYYPRGVHIHVVEGGMARHVAFDLEMFDRTDKVPDLTVDDTLDYSGFRLRAERKAPGIFEEFAVFQGASYFRAIGRDEIYGLSARGLAIDTGKGTGEEFPDFTDFWIEAPAPGARTWVLWAELDSPSVAGLYRFTIRADTATVMEVEVDLIPRRSLDHIGIAPLTSMFLFDRTNRYRFNDFRPRVHDSDGLCVLNGAGEVLWRPLANPYRLQVSSFVDDGPQGFGLMQRARRYEDFHDLEALYHQRPGLWITPGEDWGRGSVTLVEIPADKEIYDNIVAYWRPRDPLPVGQISRFTYRMDWGGVEAPRRPVARVLDTALGEGWESGYLATVDFEDHPALPKDLGQVTPFIASMSSDVSTGVLQRNPVTGGPRLAFTFDPGDRRASEMRAQLVVDGRPVSEVWLYRWTRA